MLVGETGSNDGDVIGNHSPSGWGLNDIWMFKINEQGEILWQKCYGGYGNEQIDKGVIQKNDHHWLLAGRTSTNSGDVQCNLNERADFWFFELKDCKRKESWNLFPGDGIDEKLIRLVRVLVRLVGTPNR